MIFNFWRPYPLLKPRYDGWYQCTIRHGENMEKAYVADLLYKARENKWIDTRRQQVFEGYKVYKSGRATVEENRVYSDRLCVRDSVVAWKKLPRVYKGGKKRHE